MNGDQQAAHERRLQLALAGMWEMKRGQVYVPIDTREAKRELAAGRPVYRYGKNGPVEVTDIM